MISNIKYWSIFPLELCLCGCPGSGGNGIESGIRVHLAETHVETRGGEGEEDAVAAASSTTTTTPSATSAAAVATSGGYDHANLEHRHLHDVNGMGLSLYRAYLVMDNLELVPCPSPAGFSRTLLSSLISSLIGTAEAHGTGGEPVGGRSLDRPNVIDLLAEDEFILPLGDAAVAPGRYCGLRASLVRLAGTGYGKPVFAAASNDSPTTVPEVPDLSGRVFSIRADYCAEKDVDGNCLNRAKADVDDTGLVLPTEQTLNFDAPVVLDSSVREAYLVLGIAYGEWAQDVDITKLTSDIAERQKLLDNIAASVHIHAMGLGELPPNPDDDD